MDKILEFAEVAVNFPSIHGNLYYHFDTNKLGPLKVGDLVHVPLGRRIEKGCILNFHSRETVQQKLKDVKYKEVISLIEPGLNLENEFLFYQKIAKYYHYPLGKFIFDILPLGQTLPRLSRKKSAAVSVLDRPEVDFEELNVELSDEQKAVSATLIHALSLGPSLEKRNFYLYGVTGSGKTIVYIQLIKFIQSLKPFQSVLYLVPEIGLVLSVAEMLRPFLRHPIYIYHGSLSKSKKMQLWKILSNLEEPAVILGTRSAVFLPIKNLGLIIVDEEHDSSYKQDSLMAYSGRDVALSRGQFFKTPILLGSATPCLEVYHKFRQGLGQVLKLEKRYSSGELPQVTICSEVKESGPSSPIEKLAWPFQHRTLKLIENYLTQKKQVIIFVNKLGHASLLQCKSCEHQFLCQNCSCALKYFKKKKILKCSFCQYTEAFHHVCPQCSCVQFLEFGFGTERIEKILQTHFPHHQIERLDREEVTTLKKFKQKVDKIERGELDIIVGTQILSKGFNFKNVSLVVILGIDYLLHYPDYWGTERAFQLMTQVLGRAGRFTKKAEVYIQTRLENNPVFSFVKNHHFEGFFQHELANRLSSGAPPFTFLIAIYVIGKKEGDVMDQSMELKDVLDRWVGQGQPQAAAQPRAFVLGPRPTFLVRKQQSYSWCLLLSSQEKVLLHQMVNSIQKQVSLKSGVFLRFDIDPMILT